MSNYFDDLVSRAEEIALSYGRCRELIDVKAETSGIRSYNLQVEKATLKAGRFELILSMMFVDGNRLEVMVDLNREVVHYVKWYPKQVLAR